MTTWTLDQKIDLVMQQIAAISPSLQSQIDSLASILSMTKHISDKEESSVGAPTITNVSGDLVQILKADDTRKGFTVYNQGGILFLGTTNKLTVTSAWKKMADGDSFDGGAMVYKGDIWARRIPGVKADVTVTVFT